MTIGQTIAQLRKEHGLTQEQLAERLLVSRQAVSKWETGAAQPDLDNIRALSAFFEVSADVFLCPEGQELPAEPPEPDGKREKRSWSWLLLAVLACAAPVLGWLGVRVLARHGAVVLYGWLVPMTATVFALGGVAALLVLYRRKRPAAAAAVLAAAGVAVTAVLWVQFAADARAYRAIVSHGPDAVLLLRQERETGVTVSYQQRLPLVMLRRDELSHPTGDTLKLQWLADDICAVTYVSRSDGGTHQYVAALGVRSDGLSYDNVFGACHGSWSGADEGTRDWKLRFTDGADTGVYLKVGNQAPEYYDYDDCVQFGVSALVLCRGGLPRWTIALNTDCEIEPGTNLIAPGGTLTLAQVSMDETPAYVFSCDDDTQKRAAQSDSTIAFPTREQIARETVGSMQLLAGQAAILESELPEGVQYLNAPEAEPAWLLFLSLNDMDDASMGQNGVDSWMQMQSVQRLAGDDADGCWQVAYMEVDTSPGNQGSAPESETVTLTRSVRLMETQAGGVLAYVSTEDLSFGLSPVVSEQIDLSENDAYHRFTPADFSGDNWTYLNVNRLSREEAAVQLYQTAFAAQYPQAQPLSANSRPGYRLAPGCYLVYDGMWQKDGAWVYRFWCYRTERPAAQDWNGTVDTVGYYDVPMRAE